MSKYKVVKCEQCGKIYYKQNIFNIETDKKTGIVYSVCPACGHKRDYSIDADKRSLPRL